MINSFLVRANSDKNELSVKMDGYFMKSEIELAFCLIKKEIKKLIPGFTISIDIKNLRFPYKKNNVDISQINNLARSMGAGEVKHIRSKVRPANNSLSYVGFYPYENEWFLY